MQLTARVIYDQLQKDQPEDGTELDLADHDLGYVCEFLSQSRGQAYEIVGRPDTHNRASSAPDYLVREDPSNRVIAVEHTRFMDQHLQAAKARLIRQGADVILIAPQSIDAQLVCSTLGSFLARKLARGQAASVRADERWLIVRNRALASHRTFLSANIQLPVRAIQGVDHCYLIASRRLLAIW